jgi:hypothetical protein
MENIYELELWSRPGRNLNQDYGKELEHIINMDLSLEKNICKGLSYIPNIADVHNLKSAINACEINQEDFLEYCVNQKIHPDLLNETSAALYLEYLYGRALAWLHIPCNQMAKTHYFILVEWAKKNGFVIVEADKLFCINPNSPLDIFS